MYQVILYDNPSDTQGTVIHTSNIGGQKVYSGKINKGINQVDMFDAELTFENIGYGKIRPMQTLIEVINTKNNHLEFSGRVINYTDSMTSDGLHAKQFISENELGYLHDSYQPYFEFTGMTRDLFVQLINNHNAEVEPHKRFVIGNVSLDYNINMGGNAKVHQFTWGDTLNEVARIYGVEVKDLKERNNIEDLYELYPGDTIVIKDVESSTESSQNYRIVWGDTLSQLAIRFNTTVSKLASDNNISNPDKIYAGNNLRVNTIAKKTTKQTTTRETEIAIPLQITPEESTFDAIFTHLINVYGGEIQVRNEGGVRYIDYVESIGHDSPEAIELSKNLMSITRKNDPTEIVTRLKPLGATIEVDNQWENTERVTIKSVNNNRDYIDRTDLVSEFGIQAGSVVFDEEESPANVKTKGQQWLNNQKMILQQFTVEALDLFSIGKGVEAFNVGNTQPVFNPVMALDERIRIIGKTVDIVEPINSNLTIGDKFKSFLDYQNEQRAIGRRIVSFQSHLQGVNRSNGQLRLAYESIATEVQSVQTSLSTIDVENLPIELQNIHEQINQLEVAIQNRSSPLRVATFNIWGSRIDFEAYKNFIVSNRLDIIGLQEVLETTPDDLKVYNLDKVRYIHSWYNYGNAIQSRFDLGVIDVFTLPTTRTDGRQTLIKANVEFEGRQLSVYNTHLDAGENDDVRLSQIDFIRQTMEADTTPHKILLGDFNVQDKEHFNLLGDLKSAQGHNGVWHDTWDVTIIPWNNGAIDNILVSQNIDIKKVEMPTDKMGSDHHALWAEIILR